MVTKVLGRTKVNIGFFYLWAIYQACIPYGFSRNDFYKNGDLRDRVGHERFFKNPRIIPNAKNLAPPFLSIFSGSKSMTTKINVL